MSSAGFVTGTKANGSVEIEKGSPGGVGARDKGALPAGGMAVRTMNFELEKIRLLTVASPSLAHYIPLL